MTEPDPASPLWEAMKTWTRRRGVHIEAVASSHTRTKIKRGESVKGSVYDNIDNKLGWVGGDAVRCARDGTPPRPIEGEDGQVERARVELMRTLADTIVAASGAALPALRRAKASADDALGALRAGS